jgi:hypothetical protein
MGVIDGAACTPGSVVPQRTSPELTTDDLRMGPADRAAGTRDRL